MFQLISVEWEGIERWPTFARGGNIIGEFRWFPWSWFTTCRGSEYTISISKWLSTTPVIFLNVSHDLKASHEGWQIHYKNFYFIMYIIIWNISIFYNIKLIFCFYYFEGRGRTTSQRLPYSTHSLAFCGTHVSHWERFRPAVIHLIC